MSNESKQPDVDPTARAVWLIGRVAGFGGFGLAWAGMAMDDRATWWRAFAIAVGALAVLVISIVEVRRTVSRATTIASAVAAGAVLVGFALLLVA
jgi:heme exporter protein D